MTKAWQLRAALFGVASLLGACASQPAAESGATGGAQLERGAALYAKSCAACHGPGLAGKSAIELAGTSAMQRWGGQSAADLFQRVTTMPNGAPNSLSRQQYADLTAFILSRNGIKSRRRSDRRAGGAEESRDRQWPDRAQGAAHGHQTRHLRGDHRRPQRGRPAGRRQILRLDVHQP